MNNSKGNKGQEQYTRCLKCGKRFKKLLKNQIVCINCLIKSKNHYTCKSCGETFRYKKNYDSHMKECVYDQNNFVFLLW